MSVIEKIVKIIQDNKEYLSELDGVAGDGDHGLNMEKGLTLALTRVDLDAPLSDQFDTLANTVIVDIGGSMGPLYGTLFYAFSDNLKDVQSVTPNHLLHSLSQAIEEIEEFGAKEKDKTLLDVLYPSKRYLESAINSNIPKNEIYKKLSKVALEAANETALLEAKIGRAARLGKRSIGHIDAGAMSCALILSEIAKSFRIE